eukprot:CAMPEP_0185038568 /NCGR_PEP_ID=MMETSP1103-20130426/34367_1 /TAXON_ID=36769 /ORGANISM="Paraphysomonas bandaiensis, Strain Caron Lab Isolate" /LENGTH=761 /DNA_ID=CAMNT_0027577055 /DNA_START=67 /DNA_END=2352 /DNA_ORIENTATION=-
MTGMIQQMIDTINSGDDVNRDKYLEILDSYSIRDDGVDDGDVTGGSTQDEGPSEEEIITSQASDWSSKKKYIENRPRGWLTRFASEYSRVNTDSGRKRATSDLDYASTAVTLEEPVQPILYKVDGLKPFKDTTLQSNFCLVCWNMVTVGPTRICCQHCPVVVHRYCVSNIEDYIVPEPEEKCSSPIIESGAKLPRSESRRVAKVLNSDLPAKSRRTKSKGESLEAPSLVSKIRWVCPFCIHEVNVSNDFYTRKYLRCTALHRAKKAVILIQSLVRMVPKRIKFLDMARASRAIQRFHRSRNFRRALIKERTTQKRAVRIRLHELTLYIKDTEGSGILSSFPDPSVRVFGQFGANMFPKNVLDIECPEVPNGAIATLHSGLDRRTQGNIPVTKKAIMLGAIKASTCGANSHQLQMPVKDMNGAPFPSKTLFLTVSATQVEAGQDKQLYRIDVPMRDVASDPDGFGSFMSEQYRSQSSISSVTSSTSTCQHTAYFKIIDDLARVLEGENDRFLKVKIYPPKPMILFPALSANVTIYFTVSEVVDWPRAYLIGQSSIHPDNWLIWRQVATISQGLSLCGPEDIPKGDSNSRLQIHVRNPNITVDDNVSKMEDFVEPTTKRSSLLLKSKHKPRRYIGGRILWTLVPSSFIASIAGPLFFLPQALISSTKKRCWCVILDGCLIIYSHMTDIKTKEVIDLSICNVYMLEAEVMKIYRPKGVDLSKGQDQSWFCFCATPNLRDEWFKILKDNSAQARAKKRQLVENDK